jgi:hypothetical protein
MSAVLDEMIIYSFKYVILAFLNPHIHTLILYDYEQIVNVKVKKRLR